MRQHKNAVIRVSRKAYLVEMRSRFDRETTMLYVRRTKTSACLSSFKLFCYRSVWGGVSRVQNN